MSIYILDFKQATFTSEADILFVENISNLDFKIGCILRAFHFWIVFYTMIILCCHLVHNYVRLNLLKILTRFIKDKRSTLLKPCTYVL